MLSKLKKKGTGIREQEKGGATQDKTHETLPGNIFPLIKDSEL